MTSYMCEIIRQRLTFPWTIFTPVFREMLSLIGITVVEFALKFNR